MSRGLHGKIRILAVAASLLAPLAGCLSERPVRLDPDDSRPIQPAGADRPADAPRSTRDWLHGAQRQLADLLPKGGPRPLLTEDLATPAGEPVDVWGHFGIRPKGLQSLLGNYAGLKCTAQGASQALTIDTAPPAWPHFTDVWLAMPDGARLAARFGLAEDAAGVRDADCIVVLPGFFGDNGVMRTQALAEFLRGSGLHVLALEMRGHGQTERTQPGVAYTFGVRETDDLMHVADWLQSQPHVRRTGLIGFCWSANIALLAAWYAHHPADDANISPTIAANLPARPDRVRYAAGVMAFSPIIQWERLVDALQTEYSVLGEPVYAALQDTIRARMERKCYPQPSGSLRDLIEYEYLRCGVTLPGGALEGYRFLRLVPYAQRPLTPKLAHARIPVLIVHAANDPLAPAQDVADFVAGVRNPAVAALILPGGGHVGFANHAPEYFYSLVASFFDPAAGPAGTAPAGATGAPFGAAERICGLTPGR